MSKYGLLGKLKTHSGKADEFASILLQASKLVSMAKGCALYLVTKDAQGQNCFWVTEVWDTQEDHDNSLNLPGVKELMAQALPLIDGRPESITLDVIGGAGIDLNK